MTATAATRNIKEQKTANPISSWGGNLLLKNGDFSQGVTGSNRDPNLRDGAAATGMAAAAAATGNKSKQCTSAVVLREYMAPV